ncbi:hypothetical protein JXR01_03220 [Candidatus Kaiserbacteria bacterium]|nr:MAG: hypothetical protein JXR01_03220 [Candidatus Kaiserbacteria bacterium]
MDQQNSNEEQKGKERKWPTGTGMGMGIAIGAGIGAALGNVALGVGIGVAIGAALEAQCAQKDTTSQKNIRINSILIGVGIIVFGLLIGSYFIFIR